MRVSIFFVLMLFFNIHILSLELILKYEIRTNSIADYYLIDNEVVTFNNGSLGIYKDGTLVETKNILKKGAGPGDFQIVQQIFGTKDFYFVWDRMLKRLSKFNKKWEFLDSQKFANAPTLTGFIGKQKGKNIFKWLEIQNKNNGRWIKEIIGTLDTNRKEFISLGGDFVINNSVNKDRPFIKCQLNDNKIFYANINEYKLFKFDLHNSTKKELVVSVDSLPQRWVKTVEDLQWEIIPKPKMIPSVKFPANIPTIYDFVVDNDLVVVFTNKYIKNKKCCVDIYKKGVHIGSVKIPLLYQQHLIFPAIQYFPPDVYITGNNLYTRHYDKESDEFTIKEWIIPHS